MSKNILIIAGFGVVLVALISFFLVNSQMNSNNFTNSKNLNNSNSQTTLDANSQTNSQNNSPQKNETTTETTAETNDKKANKKITNAEFTKHFSKDDCWVSFENKVYDVTTYLAIHPGGSSKLARFCSKEIDPVSMNHPGGLFGSAGIQAILMPFYVGELVE